MTDINAFMSQLRNAGVRLWLEDGRLKFKASQKKLNPELLGQMKLRKDELLAWLQEAGSAVASAAQITIENVDRKGRLPLSHSQQRLFFINELEGPNAHYNLPFALRLSGALRKDILDAAVAKIIERHESLRMVFVQDENGPAQKVLVPQEVDIPVVDTTEEALSQFMEQEAQIPFDLEKGPLIRFQLVRPGQDHILLVTMHHIISDGWSLPILIGEMCLFYNALLENTPHLPPELKHQYPDYAAFQQKHLTQSHLAGLIDWWKNRLAGAPRLLELPTDRARPVSRGFKGGFVPVHIPAQTLNGFRRLLGETGATLFMALEAVFALLLSRLAGQNDLCVGTPVANRDRPEWEPLIGLFVNTLVLRHKVVETESFLTFLTQTRNWAIAAYSHQSLPFEKMIDALNIPRDLSHHPIFQVMFDLKTDMPPPKLSENLVIEVLERQPPNINFDMSLSLKETRDGAMGYWGYRKDLFEEETIARMVDDYQDLLERVATQPHSPMMALYRSEQTRISSTSAPKASMVRLFEEQVQKTPHAPAIREPETGRETTYTDLNSQASSIAAGLRDMGVGPEVIVGIQARRTTRTMAGILGILKAGGAYLPLDPELPEERIHYMLQTAEANLVLGDEDRSAGSVTYMNTKRLAAYEHRLPPYTDLDLDHPAYVIFTSGSTGKPKGVVVSHGAIANRILWAQKNFPLSAQERFLQLASLNFDISIWELMAPLVSGGVSVLAPQGVYGNVPALIELVSRERITVMHFVPSLLNSFLDAPVERLSHLRLVFCGGEALTVGIQTRFHTRLNADLYHFYGPTEAAINMTSWRASEPGEDGLVPIGEAIEGTHALILDRYLRPCPVGTTGDLYIGGHCLARGYVNQPAQTAWQWQPHPLAAQPGMRIYASGDRARLLKNGQILFMGRADHQIKLRGLRIEPGEIETALKSHSAVHDAAVLLIKDEETPYLSAFVSGSNLHDPMLRHHLASLLPAYMIPSVFTILETMPLNLNAKIDRARLPALEVSRCTEFHPPITGNEKILAEIWEEILGVERVGREDHFFRLGGDSIISIQVIARARKAGLGLTPKQLFEHPSLSGLAEQAEVLAIRASNAEQGPVPGPLPLTPIQKRFLQSNPRGTQFNQSLLLAVKGKPDRDEMREILSALWTHHDGLRLGITHSQGNLAGPEEPVPFHFYDFSKGLETEWHRDVSQTAAHLQTTFQLEGPLIRIALMHGPTDSRLFFLFHHLVVDSVSWRIILEDFQTLWKGGALPPKTTSLKQWTQHLEKVEQDTRDLQFWEKACTPTPREVLQFLGDTPSKQKAEMGFHLDSAKTTALLQRTREAYGNQPEELMLAALLQTFFDQTGTLTLPVFLEGHGRPQSGEWDLSRTVGWLTALFPITLRLDNRDYGALLKGVKEQRRAIPEGGIGYGLLSNKPGPEPMILFNYLGQMDQLQDGGIANIAGESTGSSVDPNIQRNALLEVNCLVLDGCLQVNLECNTHAASRIALLMDALKDALIVLIEHCLLPESRGYTPSDFPLAGLDQPLLDKVFASHSGISAIYDLSPMQEGMLFHSLAQKDAYLEQMTCVFRGDLDVDAYQRAWHHVINRHDAMRTVIFREALDRPLQVVFRNVEAEWTLRGTLERFLDAERKRGFVLSEPPLMRFGLFPGGKNVWQFAWLHHHLLTDGWSLPLILAEVFASYTAFSKATIPQLTPVQQFGHYISWLSAQDKSAARAYWRQLLDGFQEPVSLGIEKGQKHLSPRSFQEISFHLSQPTTHQLQELAGDWKATLNILAQAAWAWLLSNYADTSDLVFGVTVSGRPAALSGVEGMVGLFINTLPVRARIEPQTHAQSLVKDLLNQQLNGEPHTYTPLAHIQADSMVPSGTALFESLVVFENYPSVMAIEGDELQITEARAVEHTTYPITLTLQPGDQLSVHFDYDGDRFAIEDMNRLSKYFKEALETLAWKQRFPSDGFISPQTPFDDRETTIPIHEMIAHQAALYPHAEAVVEAHPHAGPSLSRAELEAQSNNLAIDLMALGAGPETLVGICVDRSLHMISGALAVLKSGAAFVPLDPAWPADRLALMMEDAGIGILLTQSHLTPQVPKFARILNLDQLTPGRNGSKQRGVQVHGKNPAYVIYTSGSTGRPKGVVIDHDSLSRHALSLIRRYPITAEDHVLAFSSFSFDAAMEQIFPTLASGARLVVRGPDLWPAQEFSSAVRLHQITIADIPTAYWLQLVHSWAQKPDSFPRDGALRMIIVGGEVLSDKGLDLWRQARTERVTLINSYGPTETTITATIHQVDPQSHNLPVPIGKPYAGRSALVLNRFGEPAPQGVPGQLFLGGMGLARGYHKQPGLTALSFVPDGYSTIPGSRLYRTGDRARFLDDGSIRFLGRQDHQLKLRGFRVEPGEVENALGKHPQVGNCLVTPYKTQSGELMLTAYLEAPHEPNPPLAEFLAQSLPHFMIPSAFVTMSQLPLLPGGKTDRSALPAPHQVGDAYVPPGNLSEMELARIWEEVLEVKPISIESDFFQLGGHSLKAVRLLTRVQQAFGVALPVAVFFRQPTIKGMARLLVGNPLSWSPLVPIKPEGKGFPLFLAHPAGGTVMCYRKLALLLDRPLFGLQSPGVDAGLQPLTSIQAMARCYIEAIRGQQPQGPYLIGGWSMGGAVAHEMARHLNEEGQQVAAVVLLDSVAPNAFSLPDQTEEQRLLLTMEGIAQNYGKPLPVTVEELKELKDEARAMRLIEAARAAEILPHDVGPQQAARIWRIHEANIFANNSYEPQPHQSAMLLFKAKEKNIQVTQDPLHGWPPLTSGTFEMLEIPGAHESILEEPHVETLAQKLTEALAEMKL